MPEIPEILPEPRRVMPEIPEMTAEIRELMREPRRVKAEIRESVPGFRRMVTGLGAHDSGIGPARWESSECPSEAPHGTHKSRADGMAGNHSPPTCPARQTSVNHD